MHEPPRAGSHPANVLALLRKTPKDAWRAHEIADALRIDEHTVGAALRRLRARGFVDKEGPFWFALSDREATQFRMAMLVSREANERLGREDPVDWAHLPHA